MSWIIGRNSAVDLRSRHERPLARYFPELVAALAALNRSFVLDGEIVIEGPAGFDFAALLNRTHPAASRVERLARETPASLYAFDLLALDDRDLVERPLIERRAALTTLLASSTDRLRATPITEDPRVAEEWLAKPSGQGVDGVVAKHKELAYLPGERAMIKVKRERTADCVVAGFRLLGDGSEPLVGSLLLGLHAAGELQHVGVVSQLTRARREGLLQELRRWISPLEGHPWEHGFNVGRSPMGRLRGAAGRWDPATMTLDWIPLRPERVLEVTYDHLDDRRFRHPARFVRWRPDRVASSCGFEQLA